MRIVIELDEFVPQIQNVIPDHQILLEVVLELNASPSAIRLQVSKEWGPILIPM